MKCRHCHNEVKLPFLDLGTAPPSNAYLSAGQLDQPERYFPLRVLVCETCWLVQTQDFAGREELFTEDYAYFSSTSSSWLRHAEDYVAAMTERFGLGADSCVVEVAANDGYLLQYVAGRGIPCYGIEPTRSTADAARAKGIAIVEEFFGVALGEKLASEGRQADLTAANNVLAHVPDINDFVGGFARLLKPQGVSTFEFPHLLRMVTDTQFDTVYHEHYSYLSLTAVENVFRSNGLRVFDVEELSTHGGSLRVYACRIDAAHAVTPRVTEMLAREESAGITSAAFYTRFQEAAEKVKNGLMRFLLDARRDGRSVAGYGAAAKGNTMLNFMGVRGDLLEYVVDRADAKIGKFMPGSRIPIVAEARLAETRPDYIVILPWNLRDEVSAQLSYAREWGATLVTAVPVLELL
ncbi:methyltransferase domain-containing protein [Sphingomonas kyeonggiensis]|uniref:methyltransferase domain-containing protein n=1 Tax=Sphingomonas kyeonggiensis TaxID=1268553 RepID=UPI00162045F8|nr:class I SAM-dependent methyltransferase [Sphingomonas kyeonggiensis]